MWAAVAGVAGAVIGGSIAAKGSKDAAKINAEAAKSNGLDPRANEMIYGQGRTLKPGVAPIYAAPSKWNVLREPTNPESDYTTDTGLLGKYNGMFDTPQDPALAQYGQDNLGYLGNANADMGAIRSAATGLLGGTQAPEINNAAWAVGNMVDAPKQNDMDLSGAYDGFINGERGNNPYLTGAIGKGINQSQNAFTRMQDDSTRNLMENVMPGIRSNSVLAGQYGGSRQGIAEGRAMGDFGREQQRAISQFGQNNTDAAVSAQAGAYETDSNRALSATQGLGAQQYGVASQNANTKNAAEFGNVNQVLDISKANAGLTQANNALNQNGVQAGTGLLGGLLGGAYSVGQNQDSYGINQAGKVNGLLQPYLTGIQSNAQPLYQNQAGNMLGGAMAGAGLAKQFMGSGYNYNGGSGSADGGTGIWGANPQYNGNQLFNGNNYA